MTSFRRLHEEQLAVAGAIERFDALEAAGDLAGLAQWGLDHEQSRLELLDTETAFEMRRRLGIAHHIGGRPRSALPHWREIVDLLFPASSSSRGMGEAWAGYSLYLASEATELGAFDLAFHQVDVIGLHLGPDMLAQQARRQRLATLWLAGRFDEAEDQLAALLSDAVLDEPDGFVTIHAALLRRDRGDLEGALAVLERACREPEVAWFGPVLLADLYARLGRAAEARQRLEHARSVVPAYDEFAIDYVAVAEGRVLLVEGEHQRAMHVVFRGVEALDAAGRRPYAAEACWLGATILASAGQGEAARRWLSSAALRYRELACRDHLAGVERDLAALT